VSPEDPLYQASVLVAGMVCGALWQHPEAFTDVEAVGYPEPGATNVLHAHTSVLNHPVRIIVEVYEEPF
jgi:hypothetical protein